MDEIGSRALSAAREMRPALVAGRYQFINEIGRGSMGMVSRVLDRLTGRVVTLKRLKIARESTKSGPSTITEDRMMLAKEFCVLASLRHPNIVSVLDYGFDEEQQPFLTMELEENALTIVDAGQSRPLSVQVELAVQTLRALHYLHGHGIIHCDLKPENILVVRDEVKVVDFGLSVHSAAAHLEGGAVAGTFGYMAPEILRGQTATVRCDLYSLGVVLLELFTGRLVSRLGDKPFSEHGAALQVLAHDFDPRLRVLLGRMLEPDPHRRYASASEVIAALSVALGQPLSVETVATRESVLQAAPFVGRREEIARFAALLSNAADRRGGTWLVGGESGVGKSRLLEEVRIRALGDGFIVVRGQGLSQSGGPYHIWGEPLGRLMLAATPADEHAAVLSQIVPHASLLLGRELPPIAEIDSQAAQSRLMLAVEEIFRRQQRPVLVLLEDLQWVGSESLLLLRWLSRIVRELPVLLLGSFRDDEAPQLAAAVERAEVLNLGRLHKNEIAALAEAMVGATARRADLLQLIERETEGIPFLIVEVVRELAETAGQIDGIKVLDLPPHVLSGGMQRFIRRRLERVPTVVRAPLNTAAIIGREIDLGLMHALHPDVDLESWLATCADCRVLQVSEQHWRFAHDKLREQLVRNLAPQAQRLHAAIASAIEPLEPERVTALAHHWREAGDRDKEIEYAKRAGDLALQSGACREAIGYFTRVLELLGSGAAADVVTVPPRVGLLSLLRLDPNASVDPESHAFRIGLVEARLTEAHHRLGDLQASREHGVRALRYLSQYVPDGRLGWVADAVRQGLLRMAQSLLRTRSANSESARRIAGEIGRVQFRLTEGFFYSLETIPVVWSSFRMVNQCAPAGPSRELAHGYVHIGVLASSTPLQFLSAGWCRRALEIAEQTCPTHELCNILVRSSIVDLARCRWEAADAKLQRASLIAEQVGDLRLWGESYAVRGAVALYRGEYEDGLRLVGETLRLSRRGEDRQLECWGLLGQADMLVRLGREHEALPLYTEAMSRLTDTGPLRTEAIWGHGMFALTRLRIGDMTGAFESAERALSHIAATRPIAYWTQHGTAATAEVFTTLLESNGQLDAKARGRLAAHARQACIGLKRFAARFPLGLPHAHLWEGLRAWGSGRPLRAFRHWHRALTLAERLGTRYELARAHLEIGRHLAVGDARRDQHLHDAAKRFEQLGCATDLTFARSETACTGGAREGERAC